MMSQDHPGRELLAAATRDEWRRLRPDIEAMVLRLGDLAELSLLETRSAETLARWLAGRGFQVECGVAGIPTAFVARAGKGAGPVVGLLAEYDALPGQGNRAEPRRTPDGRGGGHACGHNQIGAAVAGAAIAAHQARAGAGRPGRLVVLGCPAEELLWGKLVLLEEGACAGLDALLACHADYQNGALSRPCLACVSAELHFEGAASHGGALRSQNAPEALELTVQTVERIPLGRVNWAIPGAVPLHHWGTTALSGSAAGLPGPVMAGEAVALAAVELATNPAVVGAARDELVRRVGGQPPSPPRWAPVAALAGQPERFWDGSWRSP